MLAAAVEILWAANLAVRYEVGRLFARIMRLFRVGQAAPEPEPLEPLLPLEPRDGWRVIYFDAANRGECLRLILACQDVPFEDVRLEFPAGLLPYKSAALGDASPLAFDQAPVVQHARGGACVSVAQTVAAAQYCGLATGLAPSDPAALSLATSACCSIQEMYDELYYGSWLARYFCDAVCPGRNCLGACVCYATARYRMTAKHRRWCETFERWLRKQPVVGGVAFLAGGALSFADLCFFDCVEGFEACGYLHPADRAAYPLVGALVRHCAALPSVARYLAEREPRFETAPPRGFVHPRGTRGATPWSRTAARRKGKAA